MQDVVQMKKSSLYAGFFECHLRCLDIDPDHQALSNLIPTSYARCNSQNQSLSE